MSDYNEDTCPVELEGVCCQFERELAIYCWYEDEPGWVPKSQLHPDSEVRARGDVGVLIIPAWLAAEKGWKYL
jgi:hypothetical protein